MAFRGRLKRATLLRRMAAGLLLAVLAAALLADVLCRHSYATQFREAPNAPPDRRFPLGTDELGRDRLARLLHGTRVSLLLAPAAALLATAVAAAVGLAAGHWGGWWERALLAVTDLFLSLPWLFLLLTVRAVLPLNVAPAASLAITFALLGLLGWASAARVVCAGVRALQQSEFLLQARATGCRTGRLLCRHLAPNLKPVLLAQFWISVPAFLLSEANLGLLGLGVTEPLPSWGGLLRELENFQAVRANPWMLAPAGLLVAVVSSLQILMSSREETR